MDARTRAYLRELANATETNRKLADDVQEICTCVNCIEARANKTLAACDNGKLMREMHAKIIGTRPSNHAYARCRTLHIMKRGISLLIIVMMENSIRILQFIHSREQYL